ncbi:pseudaminic acid cytidylyltransferase [Thermosynechococcaceae cyanobacterium Okahandja]
MNIAVIPARGGSKRIPRKNIRPFHGKPIIAYTIEAAKQSGVFDQIIVSTDDEAIGTMAKSYGAEFPFIRPPQLADDYAGTVDVVSHAVQWLVDQKIACTYVCCLYATAPFLMFSIDYIRKGLDILQKSNQWDYIFSATTFPSSVFRSFSLTDEGGIEMLFPEHRNSRSQDLPEMWHDAAQFYWGTTVAWLEKRAMVGGRSTVIKLPRWQVQDIDTEDDWLMAERLYGLLMTKEPS